MQEKTKKITFAVIGSLLISSVGYIIFEILFYFIVYFGIVDSTNRIETYVNKGHVAYDPVYGYKFLNSKIRIMRIHDREVIFDFVFTPNNIGRYSNKNYLYKKKNKDTHRIIVFGDSFTEGVHLKDNWPDKLEQLLNVNNKSKFEVYSFAVDGGGIFNAHNIFFNDVIKNYEFDSIIYADYDRNLNRGFSIAYFDEDSVYFSRNKEAPLNVEDFNNNYKGKENSHFIAKIIEDNKIDERINSRLKYDHYFLNFIKNRTFQLYAKIKFKINLMLNNYKPSLNDNKSNQRGVKMLEDMISYSKSKSIPFMICAVPSIKGLLYMDKHENVYYHQKQLEQISLKNNIEFFDGYNLFKEIGAEKVISDFYIKKDGHWNQTGSDYFVKKLVKKIN